MFADAQTSFFENTFIARPEWQVVEANDDDATWIDDVLAGVLRDYVLQPLMLSISVPLTERDSKKNDPWLPYDVDNPPCAVWTMRLVLSPNDGAWVVDATDGIRSLDEVLETLEEDHLLLTRRLGEIGYWDESDLPVGKVLLLTDSEIADTDLIEGVADVLVVGRCGLPSLAALLRENPPSAAFVGDTVAARHLAADILATGAVSDLNGPFLPPCLPRWMIEASSVRTRAAS